jgi:hypothetical protein
MGMGRSAWKEARSTITRLLSKEEGIVRDSKHRDQLLVRMEASIRKRETDR